MEFLLIFCRPYFGVAAQREIVLPNLYSSNRPHIPFKMQDRICLVPKQETIDLLEKMTSPS